MPRQTFHAVIYKDARNDRWVAFCVEYDVATQGDNPEHALEMIQEAMELHFEDADAEIVSHVDNEVGSPPLLLAFEADVPAFPLKEPVDEPDDLMNPKVVQAILRQAGLSYGEFDAALQLDEEGDE